MSIDTVVKHRDQYGPNYKGVAIHALPGLHERVFELVQAHFVSSLPILELGAGSGALSLRMKDGGYEVRAVDLDGADWKIDTPLVEANFNDPDWHQTALAGEQFRQVISLETIEHLENPSKYFRDIAALLEPGGKLILSTPNVLSTPSLVAGFKRAEFALFSAADCVSSGHISILPWWLLQHLGKSTGLRCLQAQGVSDVPMGASSRRLVSAARRLRQRFLGTEPAALVEGLNVIMIFEKDGGDPVGASMA